MANVSQIEDKNGVVKDIVDKGLDEKTSQNSIASSDYVLLEDNDGAYHKIAKASFTEAVRSALGAVINSVAKGNDIAKVPVLDSNNDLGMGTLANFASVLGDHYIPGNVITLNALINLLCDFYESRHGTFSVCGSWTNHANGYHALIMSSNYGGSDVKISGIIYDWANAKAHLFEAMRQDAQNWTKKTSEISLS